MTPLRHPNVALAALLTALLSVIVGIGCGASGNDRAREYFPDMARGPAYKAFAPNAATRDGPDAAGARRRDDRARPPGVPLRPRRGRSGARGPRAGEPAAGLRRHDRGRPRPLPDVLPDLPRRERQGRRPAGRRGQDPDAARVHVRPCGAVPTRPHLPRRHDGHAEDAVVRGAADARRALEGGRLRQPHAANQDDTRGESASSARRAPSREGSGTLPGFPNETKGRAAP